jgi:hypothetical protein
MIHYIFILLSILSPLVPIIIFTTKPRALNFQLRVLFILSLCSLTFDLLSYLIYYFGYSSILIFNLYTIIKLILSSLMIIKSSESYSNYPFKFNLSLLFLISLTCLIANYFQNGIYHSNLLTNVLTGLFIIYLSIVWFYFLLLEMKEKSLNEYYLFWIISGFLISNSLSFFVNISEEYIRTNQDNSAYLLWIINLVSNIIFNIFITIGLIKFRKN